MGPYFPLISFSWMRDDALANKAGIILLAMSANTLFPAPSPSLTHVEAALDDFRTKLETAGRKGSQLDTTLKDQSRGRLIPLLQKLGRYVREVSEGDRAVIQSSGFTCSSDRRPGDIPEIPLHVMLRNGQLSGELKLSFSKVEGARLYEYRYAKMPATGTEPVWSDRFTTSNSRGTVISGLTRVTEYLVQVRALNNHGASDWSQPVAHVVM